MTRPLLPTVDFARIRPFRGSQNLGFEELICQLAALEPRPAGALFVRKGPGQDQGVECFRHDPYGKVTGWQAKWFWDFGSIQTQKLSESLDRALEAHPGLQHYIVCLPIDLTDNRSGKTWSQLQHYVTWRRRRIAEAKAAGRTLEIELWSASQIGERLGRDSPLYAGRLLYWFDESRLCSAWLRQRFEEARADLGNRYTPESHVDLAIEDALRALARHRRFTAETDGWRKRFSVAADTARRALHAAGLDKLANNLADAAKELVRSLTPPPADEAYPLATWADHVQATHAVLDAAFEAELSPPVREILDKDLYDLFDALRGARAAFGSQTWSALNAHQVLVYGEAGTGKSHLLADIIGERIADGAPAVLILSNTLVDGNPWQQILARLDLSQLSASTVLGALDAAAEALGCRALFAVDALNERHGLDLWPDRIRGFLKSFEPFRYVAVVLSVRTGYRDHLNMDLKALLQLHHRGFAGRAGEAARAYLDRRGIARPGAPELAQEFENPLFLRTCCDYLDDVGAKELPRGLRGVTTLFNFYLEAIARRIEARLKLDRLQRLPQNALAAFAEAAVVAERGGLPKATALALFESVLPSQGRADRSLLNEFLSEGALTLELHRRKNPPVEYVRFTFERFSDHLIAKRLLDSHVDIADPAKSFTKAPLHELVFGEASWRSSGIVEALAIQLPERTGREILDVAADDNQRARVEDAFWRSLAWRESKAFTAGTLGWVEELARFDGSQLFDVLIRIATDPDNAFNAEHLHQRLSAMSMPDRDACWSIHLAHDDLADGEPLETLIDWAWQPTAYLIDEERAVLAAVVLTWAFTTSNRAVRDHATKALVNLLATRLAIGAALLRRFAAVDDPYVLERLLASLYGAALQGRDNVGLPVLTLAVFEVLFKGGTPPTHILTRDYGTGLIEYAAMRNALPSDVDTEACTPPFASPWPLQPVSDDEIASFVETHDGRTFRSNIVSSTEDDFGRYVIDRVVHEWSSLPLEAIGKTPAQVYDAWESEFLASASPEQAAALRALWNASTVHARAGAIPTGFWQSVGMGDEDEGEVEVEDEVESVKLPDQATAWEAVKATDQAFTALLTPSQIEAFRDRARLFIQEAPRRGADAAPFSPFDAVFARRWVCRRAHELGWSEAKHGAFDRSSVIDRSRMGNHRVERIGKKYQWIALAELAASLADHRAMLIERYGPDAELGPYRNAIDIGLRDVDPSLLLTQTEDVGWGDTVRTWWTPASPDLQNITARQSLAWLASEQDIFRGPELLEVTDPAGRRWLVLDAFYRWRLRWSRSADYDGPEPETWTRIFSLVTKRKDAGRLVDELGSKDRADSSSYPSYGYLEGFLGEHSWRNPKPGRGWLDDSHGRIATLCLPTTLDLLAESNTRDNSIAETINARLPAGWVIDALGMHLCDGSRLDYVAGSQVLFQDPSPDQKGSSCALVDREAFIAMLEREELEAVWIVAGEKNVYSGGMRTDGWGGRLIHTTIYRLHKSGWEKKTRETRLRPSSEQLNALLRSDRML